ncbi:MAG TPA: GNAT family N-acetyltransferase [Acidimicrobiales bacterium]|jgi:GNAT superfamily N-acetyltransferase
MPVRPAVESDLNDICALVRELADYERLAHEVAFDVEDVRRHLFGPDPAASVLLATADEGDDEQVVGFALWFRTFSTFLGRPGIWLEDLFVRPEHRGQGHGTALITTLRTMTDGRVEWAVLDWNGPSIAFYENLGAAPLREWTTYRWSPAASS